MLRDSRGFLWLGTEDGLNKYDGYDFRIYRSARGDHTTLSDNWISDIMEDHSGQLWVVTQKGLDRFDRKTGKVVRIAIPFRGDSVRAWSLHEDQQGRLWLTTDRGVFRLSPSANRLEQVSLPKGEYRFVTQDSKGTLWFGTWGDGILALNPESGAIRSYRQYMQGADNIRFIDEQADGRLWVGTESGLYIFDPRRALFQNFETETRSTFAQLGHVHTTAIHEDRLGRKWVGTRNNGLFIIDLEFGRMVHLTSRPDSPLRLANNTVWSISEDPSGLIWLGMGTAGGLGKLSERRFHNEDHHPENFQSLSHDAVWSILEDRHGGLWVGTSDGLNYRARNENGFKHFRADLSSEIPLPDSRIWALAESKSGEIWIGTFDSGIVRHNPSTGVSEYLEILRGSDVRALENGHDGTLWIGTDGDGLSMFDPRHGTFRTYSKRLGSGLSDDRVWAVLETRSGEVWIGTDGSGIDVFNPTSGSFRNYVSEEDDTNTIGSNRVWALYEDRMGRIWAGAKDGGLNLFQENCDCFRRYTELTHALPNDTVYGILEHEDGTLWLSTNNGLSNFDPETEEFVNFDVHDGLPTNEFSFGAYYQGSNGIKYFGSIKGITSFWEVERHSDFQPPVVITELTLASGVIFEELSSRDVLTLEEGDEHFSFSFSSLDYRSPNSNRYKYLLHGIDGKWRETDARKRVASYSNLAPGTYTLEVHGTNRAGRWSEHFTSAQVIVPATFWQRDSVRAAAVALFLLAVLIELHRRRKRYQRIQRLLFEGREAERSEVADLIHEGPMQSIIAARNQLRNIGDWSSDQGKGAASLGIQNALDGVVQDLRDVCLEMARPSKLSEAGLVTAMYAHLRGLEEGKRPLPKVEIRIEEDIEEFLIPSDLLVAYRIFQKAVNNVIQHAAATHLSVRARRVGDSILLEVEDDGVGFLVPVNWSELAPKHYGLLSAQDAAKSVGGRLEVKSDPKVCTILRAWLPVRRSQRFGFFSLRRLLARFGAHIDRGAR